MVRGDIFCKNAWGISAMQEEGNFRGGIICKRKRGLALGIS